MRIVVMSFWNSLPLGPTATIRSFGPPVKVFPALCHIYMHQPMFAISTSTKVLIVHGQYLCKIIPATCGRAGYLTTAIPCSSIPLSDLEAFSIDVRSGTGSGSIWEIPIKSRLLSKEILLDGLSGIVRSPLSSWTGLLRTKYILIFYTIIFTIILANFCLYLHVEPYRFSLLDLNR